MHVLKRTTLSLFSKAFIRNQKLFIGANMKDRACRDFTLG